MQPKLSASRRPGEESEGETAAFTQELLEKTNKNYDSAVNLAFDVAYNRRPTARETEIAKKTISAEKDPQEGLRLFIQAMFGANNFLYSY